MSRFYGFNLSPKPIDLSGAVFAVYDVGVDPPVLLKTVNVGATDETVEFELPDGRLCEAQLVDTRDGVALQKSILKFSTPVVARSRNISIYSSEEASSSSSTSSVSSSSSSSVSSSSSSPSSLSSSSSSPSSLSSSSSSSLSSQSSSSSSHSHSSNSSSSSSSSST